MGWGVGWECLWVRSGAVGWIAHEIEDGWVEERSVDGWNDEQGDQAGGYADEN